MMDTHRRCDKTLESDVKFYDCQPAPSPRRVRIFIAEKGIEIEAVEVDLANREQLSDGFKKTNPDCTVPVLQLDDGICLTEIFAICQYLEEICPEPPLMGVGATERALVTMWNTKIEHQGLAALSECLRNRAKGMTGRALTGPDDYEQIPELVDRGRRRFGLFMEKMNGQLQDSEYVVGDTFTVADISLLVAIDFAAWSNITIGETMLNLRRWYELVSVRPGTQV
jgi:glutathione S-transferase